MPCLENINKEIELTTKLEEFLTREEDMWRQKSREVWLKEGDRNTKFFHTSTINKRRINKIDRIKNDQGAWLEDRDSIGSEICRQLTITLSSKGPRSLHSVREVIKPILTQEDDNTLISIPTIEEIKSAHFQIGDLKALGPDGYPTKFFQHI